MFSALGRMAMLSAMSVSEKKKGAKLGSPGATTGKCSVSPLTQKKGFATPNLCYPHSWKCKGRLPPFSGRFCVTHARRPPCPCLHTRSAHPCHADGRPARVCHRASLDGDACRRGDCLGRHSQGCRTDAGAGTARVPSPQRGRDPWACGGHACVGCWGSRRGCARSCVL